jgi:signal transduction histidine kinase
VSPRLAASRPHGNGVAPLYERVVASLPGLCFAYDLQGSLLAWNDAFQIASGFSHGELALRTLRALVPDAAADLLAIGPAEGRAGVSVGGWDGSAGTGLAGSRDRGVGEGALRMGLVTRQGRRLALEAAVSPLIEGGRVVGGVVVGWDLREVERRQEQMIRIERLRALNELASGISHNINNRLTVILGRAQLAAKSARDEDLQDDLRAITRAARQSADLVQRLQNSTAFWVDRRTLPPIDVNDVVHEAAAWARAEWRGVAMPPITIIEDLADVAQPKGLADELQQVVRNMLTNAREAMPEGGTITVSTRQQGHWLLLRVRDTGEGMTEEVRRRVFDPLFTTRGPKSAGLGLSIAYGIVARHGGDIDVESAPGRGATFTVRLPTGLGDREAAHERSAGAGQGRILVVDDEGEICQMLTRLLSGEGYQVSVALDGQTALSLCSEGPFDLVITDLGMPDMSGWELADGLRALNPATRVLMVSGWELDVDRARLEEYNILEVLNKPFEIRALLDAVSRCLAAPA